MSIQDTKPAGRRGARLGLGGRIALTAGIAGLGAVLAMPAAGQPAFAGHESAGGHPTGQAAREPRLLGRAVLPVETYAAGPASGAFYGGTVNPPIKLPTASQPVEGFSAIVAGRKRGEYLAMSDNGFGNKQNSRDFLLRAYYLTPHFKTARGGSGGVDVDLEHYIEFRDPNHKFGFPIFTEGSSERLFTGWDIDPESLQRGRDGTLWVGDEFGPWVLHFSRTGVLLDAPTVVDGYMSPQNPALADPAAFTQPRTAGFEGMAISPNRKYLYAAFEGAHTADLVSDPLLRTIHEFSIRKKEFTGRVWKFHTENPGDMISDMQAIDSNRMFVLTRDALSGAAVKFRKAYLVDLRKTDSAGVLDRKEVLDMIAIPDPDLISLPAIHPGDVGIGNPFAVVCQSIEIAYQLKDNQYLLGCDNNFPASGRNPALADDNEFIVVDIPAVQGHGKGHGR